MSEWVEEGSKNEGQQCVALFKALANEERMQIMILLHQNGEMFAQDIQKNFYLEQSTTSHHLNILRKSGFAKIRKEGRKIFYSLEYDRLKQVDNLFRQIFFG